MKSVEEERKGVDAAITELLERERQLMNLPQPTQAQVLELASVRDEKIELRKKENKLLDEKNKLRDERSKLLDIARPAAGAWATCFGQCLPFLWDCARATFVSKQL